MPCSRPKREKSSGSSHLKKESRMPPQRPANHTVAQPGVTRRTFLGTSLAGSAALLGGLGSLAASRASAAASASAIWIEKTIPQLQTLMAAGALTSLELTRGYIERL